MKIQKLNDGSTRVELENGNVFYVKKGIDPIDGMIDIGLMQQQTASFLNKPASAEDYVLPLRFLLVLSRTCFKEIGVYTNDMDWHIYVAQEFNSEITRQQVHQTFNELNTEVILDCEKYDICYLDLLPEIVAKPSETIKVNSELDCDSEHNMTMKEDTQYMVASSLLRLLHVGLDIRTLEARISELKGLCEYLKMNAPDEYFAYCLVVDRLGLDAELDIDVYYELLEQIMQE